MASATIEGKYLKGLKFKTAEAKREQDENGRKKVKHFPVERPLKAEDVLDWKDLGATVVIVAGDGRKHRVEKDAKGGGANAAS